MRSFHSTVVMVMVVMVMVMVMMVEGGGDLLSSHDDLLTYYSGIKINEGCFSRELVKRWVQKVKLALHECEVQSQRSGVVQRAEYAGPHIILIPADWDKIVSQFYSATYRQKRGASFSAEKIRSLKEKLELKIKKFRCAMQKINVTDSNNRLAPAAYRTNFHNLGIRPAVVRNIEGAIDDCYKMATCLPSKRRTDVPVPNDVVQAKTFLECETKRRHFVCMLQDLKSHVAEGTYDLTGAGDWLRDIPTAEGKAAALVWADRALGGGDFGLI